MQLEHGVLEIGDIRDMGHKVYVVSLFQEHEALRSLSIRDTGYRNTGVYVCNKSHGHRALGIRNIKGKQEPLETWNIGNKKVMEKIDKKRYEPM